MTVAPTNEVVGYIDGVDSGFIFGWGLAKDSNNDVSTITIETSDGQIVARGVTEIFRGDLVQKGIAEKGTNGFQLPIHIDAKLKQDSKLNLYVDGILVEKSGKATLKYHNGYFWGAVLKLPTNELNCTIVSESFEGESSISLYHNESIIYRQPVILNKGENFFKINIPHALFDNTSKIISLGVAGFPFLLWSDYIHFEDNLTPWEYLKSSSNSQGMMALSKQAQFRYESLALNLNNQKNSSEVGAAHNVIAEGWQGRKKFPKLTLPKHKMPEVSIIIPAYNKFELTYNCIASIILAFNKTSYEVLVADDNSTDETSDLEDFVDNIVHVKSKENLRFLLNCNNAAEYTKGDYIVFLNNDTEVTSYWLDELIAPFEADEKVGLTGSKLLNTNGTLQEAGGIIWGSGQPWNYGNGANASEPKYNYNRQADYLSGASLCIPKTVWQQVGGFSIELVPCYYEDTDIAFKVRQHGYTTIYCPLSRVVHFEGQSHGTDITKGLKAYQVVNESTFKSKWFQEYKHNGKQGVAPDIEKDRGIDHRVLMIDYATPNPTTDAGSYAAVEEIKLIQALGIKVTFVPENMAHLGSLTHDLQRMGVEVLYAPFYNSVFDAIEKRITEFDAIYITRFSVAEKYLDAIRARTQAKIIFNNADLHFLRELRTVGKTNEYTLEQALATRAKELDVLGKVDAVLSYNETEHAVILSHILKQDNIFKCPWVLSPKTAGKSFAEREGIAFLGGYRHHPNVKAVEFFAMKVMPLITKANPNIIFYVYGSHVPEQIKMLESDNIKIVGFAENLDDVFHNHRLIVAPLLSGAGIKGKVLEAMAYGVPQVLTSVGAEATGLNHKISAWIKDEEQGLAEGVLQLYNDEQLWNKCSENSQIIAQESFSYKHGVEMMQKIFNYIGIYTG
jgi:GT2 family glycosyltransferase